MAYGTYAGVRSHRRRRRGRQRVAPWITGTLVTTLVLVGLGFGYTQLLATTCSGEETIRIAAARATAPLLATFAREWNSAEHATSDGVCARVDVQSMDSAEVAIRLAAGWDPSADPPHVWIPASTAWAQRAAASDLAEPLIPDLRPSIARSPTVIAMLEPMAVELNWPDTRLEPDADVRWESLLEEFGDDGGEGWARFGHPEWGPFRFGMSNPARDTAGLLALTSILDANVKGETDSKELENAFRLQQMLDPERYHETTSALLAALAEADAQGAEEAMNYVSAFPALEQEVLQYNRRNPAVPLAAIYPSNGNIEADYPYLVLQGEWVSPRAQEVAGMFLSYIREPGPQLRLREAGFRGPNREPGADFDEDLGLLPHVQALPRAVLVPESVTLTIDRWTALTRPFNVLIVFDVSGSMAWEIPGTGRIRMEQAVEAAVTTVEMFSDDDRVGLWEFSTALNGDLDYQPLVSIGALEDIMGDGRTRREHILSSIQSLAPRGDTGLYNTIQAAYDTVLANYIPDSTNMVVVLTDGRDDTGGRPGISLEQLLDHLAEAPAGDQQVRVVTVAFGEEADHAILQRIAEATGGSAYLSRDGFDLTEVFRSAVFAVAQ